jgi:hypothetical protein
MEKVVVEWRVYIARGEGCDLTQSHLSQVDAESLVIPEALIIQPEDVEGESQEGERHQQGGTLYAAWAAHRLLPFTVQSMLT